MDISNPKQIAEIGEKIYETTYKSAFEVEHPGRFVAIDVSTSKAFLGDTAEGAMEEAHKASPKGLFHLIKVGSPGAFRVGYANDTNLDWFSA
jgi:hypothetical protein